MNALNVSQVRASNARRQKVREQDCAQLQADISELSKREAVDLIHARFRHLSRSWIVRKFEYITELDPGALAVVLSYVDPTGETAARNVDASRRGGAHAHV